MQWLEITINTSHENMQSLTDALAALDVLSLITEDEQDVSEFLRENKKYWDYVDEDFMKSIRGICRVKFYLEDSPDGRSELLRLSAALPGYELTERTVRDEDWENNWKAYYKPVEAGRKLLIVPSWEEIPENSGRSVLRLDPGLIFGTGTHATTQMCLEAIEDYAAPGTRVLDLGCGSGILALAALLLGSDRATGCDIDDKAPGVVMENAALNGIYSDRLTVFAGDVLSDRDLSRRLSGERFQIVTANIVADVIISLSGRVRDFMTNDGVFICSGIIEGREDEVRSALEAAGLHIIRSSSRSGWNSFVCGI